MSSVTEADLIAQIAPVLAQSNLELDSLNLTKAGKHRVLEIAIDGNVVDLDAIASASRKISQHLDETDLMGEQPYTLEVTTRGIDRPLIKPVHWQRNVGRLVKFDFNGTSIVGRIMNFADPNVQIDTGKDLLEINITQINQAIIQVEFNKPSEQS